MTAVKITPDGGSEEKVAAIKTIAAYASFIRAKGLDDTEYVPSPCISVCRVDQISAWSRLDNDGKRGVWRIIEQRATVSLAALNAPAGGAP
jgi:predicted Fe-S protein YdhL (DUF1289 family)